jgi:hypothetical protein
MHNYDLIINYSASDNEVMESSSRGWVTNFERFLTFVVEQFLGRKPNILTSSNLNAKDASASGIMICILSPSFAKDTGCVDALKLFKGGSEKINGRHQILKVVKCPVPNEEQPEILKDLLAYDFYYINNDTDEPEEISKFFSKEAEKYFWLKLVDLVYDIQDLLKPANNGLIEDKNNITLEGEIIYLAETTSDLSSQRSLIKRELQSHGYKVLPEVSLANRKGELEDYIKSDLQKCKLSIHLIGQSLGDKKDSTGNIVELQNRLAVEYHQKLELEKGHHIFHRMIWLSPGLVIKNEKQRAFIEGLKRDSETVKGAEILQIPIEDFKTIMKSKMTEISDNKQLYVMPELAIDQKVVYLIYDKMDREKAQLLASEFHREGYYVTEPGFEGNLLHLRQQHIENLKNCDLAIIFQDDLNEYWIKMKMLDLIKAPGFGKEKPFIFKGICYRSGVVKNPSYFTSFGVELINLNDNSVFDFMMHPIKK